MGFIAETFVKVRPDTTGFRLETQRGIRGALTGLGASGAAAGLGFGVAGAAALAFGLAAKEAVGGAAALEQELNVFEVTSEATAAQMAAISKEARALGADITLPAVSAGDAAVAMTELAKAGLEVDDVLSGARGTLQLAASANIGFAESAVIVGDALNAFKLPGEQAAHVADLLTGASIAVSGEVTDMAAALAQSAAVAHQLGIPIEDLVGMITLLAKNGIKGSDAGTSIRTALIRLIPTTKEATDLVRALGIETSDAAGNILPAADIFDQYRVALDRLTPALRQEVLAQIFGTDAIRAAAIFASAGADGLNAMRDAADRQGAAAEVSAARTKGLSGQLSGLGSNAETLATNIGGLAVPALTDLTTSLSEMVAAANDGFTALENLGDVEVGGFSIGDAFGEVRDRAIDLVPVVSLFHEIRDSAALVGEGVGLIADQFDNADDSMSSFASHAQQELGDLGIRKVLTSFVDHAQGELADRAKLGGGVLGSNFSAGIAKGIESAEELAVRQARSSLAAVIVEGRRAVAEAIAQGDEAIAAATQQAKQNLVSIATDLAGQAAQIIDQGPLARRIAELRASLTAGQGRAERSRLKESLETARKELEDAQSAVSTGGRARSKAQQAAVDEFLTPFQRKVRDAKAALAEFNTEGVIAELQAEADAQKKIVSEGIADLVQQFNKGALSLDALSQRTARLLRQNGVSIYGETGKALGAAFKTEFLGELEALRRQAAQITIGPKTATTGTEPNVVDVGGAIRGAAAGVAAAQQAAAERLQGARDQLARATTDQLEAIAEKGAKDTTLQKILAAVSTPGAGVGGKPSPRGAPIPVSGR